MVKLAVLAGRIWAGAEITIGDDRIELDMKGKRSVTISVHATPTPGFPAELK